VTVQPDPDETQQPITSRTTALVQVSASSLSLDKEKPKEVRFDKTLKKDPSKGLNAPFRFDILTHLPISQLVSLCTSYFASRKKTREALRDTLVDSEFFLTQVPIPTNDNGISCPNVIWCSDRCHPSPSLSKTCSSKIISMIYLYWVYWLYMHRKDLSRSGVCSEHHLEETSLLPRHPTKQVVDHYYNHIYLQRRE